MELLCVAGLRPYFIPNPLDGCRIKSSEILRCRRIQPSAAAHRLGATLFERRIVKERIGISIQHSLRKR